MNDTAELKPCPFCGGEADVVTVLREREWIVCCHDCQCGTCAEQSTEAAIAAWNRRVEA